MEDSKTFYLKGDKKFSSIKTFAKELIQMPKEVYEHHVNNHKNDFSTWVKHSVKDEKLAQKIEGEIDKIEMEITVLRHLVHEIPAEKKPVKKKVVKKDKKPVVKAAPKKVEKSTPKVKTSKKVVKKINK